MGSRSRRNEAPDPAARQAAHEAEYRDTAAALARTLVAGMFEDHRACANRKCRVARRCLAYASQGFCPVDMDSRRACVLAGMMLFHDVLHEEVFGIAIAPEDGDEGLD